MSEQLPAFFTDRLLRQYGADITAQILTGMQQPRRTSLRVNRLRSSPEEIADQLTQADLPWERVIWSEDALLLPPGSEGRLWKLPAYEQGAIYLQSLSSMLPPLALVPQAGADILDMAAAPGGKTAQIAALTGNKANITACELNKIRAEKLRHTLQKQGAARVNVMVSDARRLEDFFRFDQILLDAPCSGSGTLLLCEPSTMRAFSEKLVRNSAALQLQLLRKALSLLKAGGSLVYSTCSILEEENENVVRAALKGASAEIAPVPFPTDGIPLLPTTLSGALCVRPTEEYEGFFLVRIVKK